MLVSARRIRAPRKTERSDVLWDERLADLFKDKHTPCMKTNRLKRQNRIRVERAVRAKPLGESGPFFSHIGNAIFCPLFHRRIFYLFLYQVAKSAFVISACTPHFQLIHNTFSPIKNIFLPRKLPFDPFTLFNGHVLRFR